MRLGKSPSAPIVATTNKSFQEPYVNCPCIKEIVAGPPQVDLGSSWLAYQQQWLGEVAISVNLDEGPCVPIGNAFDSELMLRILPLGASIVYGYESIDGNGFRASLREQLIANNAAVNFVGELQVGTMLDNHVEGVSQTTCILHLSKSLALNHFLTQSISICVFSKMIVDTSL
jgi:hypothetical protein